MEIRKERTPLKKRERKMIIRNEEEGSLLLHLVPVVAVRAQTHQVPLPSSLSLFYFA